MKVSFHGAARTVTGSKHLLQLDNGKKILLDCGLFQGMGRETLELNRHWGFDPADISYVILSHAHIDHIGLLPKLVKDGFNGRIYCTPQTAQLSVILLRDSAHIQKMDILHVNKARQKHDKEPVLPLYTEEEAALVFPLFEPVPYHKKYKIDNDVTLLYTDCGHILGSAAINLEIKEGSRKTKFTFSGDVGRYGDMILCSPEPFPQADYIVMESTYGDKLHDMLHSPVEKLLKCINETCIKRGGKLLIPAFSVGRTQEILYLLNRLDTERRLPQLDYFVDSPLSIEATEIMKKNAACFNENVKDLLTRDDDVFAFPGLQYTKTADESIALMEHKGPCVIIAASGMAEAGRIKHHIAQSISDPATCILLAGYCEPHSLGGKLRNGARHVNIYGDEYDVNAHIEVIDSMSAHGDYEALLKWLSCQDPEKVKKIFLVHGEHESQVAFKHRLEQKGFKDITIPELHQEFDLAATARKRKPRVQKVKTGIYP